MKPNREAEVRHQRKARPRAGADGAFNRLRQPSVSSGVYALVFGLFLGLCILKFGNPVVLDQKITAPTDLKEAWRYAWPVHWAFGLVLMFAMAGAWQIVSAKSRWPVTRWLWILPLVWFGLQVISATCSVDRQLSVGVLWQFDGCLAAYFIGVLLLARRSGVSWLLIGLLAAFTFCLVRGVDQRLFEFPQERQQLLEGERTGWTNFESDVLLEMKRERIIITTNGIDVANPVILAKYGKELPPDTSYGRRLVHTLFAPNPRVMGTLVYSNALAGLILLLWPLSIMLAFNNTRRFRTPTRVIVIGLTLFLGGAGLFWTGSKLGWLMAVLMAGIWFWQSKRSGRWKYIFLSFAILAGLAVFVIRFHSYFAAGATSVGARFDYWGAAVRITGHRPFLGSGPGTFQIPYAGIKSPEAEMTRLVHNDYLEQFSDSGIPAGISYVAWIVLSLLVAGRKVWRSADPLRFALYLGLLGWFLQGLGEFSLYIPALAWSAFTLLGCLIALSANQIDTSKGSDYN